MIESIRRNSLAILALLSLLIPLAAARADATDTHAATGRDTAGKTHDADSAAAAADPAADLRLPLRNGRISITAITDALRDHLHLAGFRHLPVGDINVRGLEGSWIVAGMNRALDEACDGACRLEVDSDALVLHFDPRKLPHTLTALKASVRKFTALAAPKAAAAQERRWGMTLPATIDPARPLVVLVHGLDSDASDWGSMGGLLDDAGYQTARFDYPADGPVSDDVARFSASMKSLHERYQAMRIDIVAYSMGSLVSRGYVEGTDYAGGVDRLILIAPPNHGSTWTPLEPLAKADYEWHASRGDAEWSSPWIILSGLGEAGNDLTPGSRFLAALNARPRRPGVRYTIIEGDQTPMQRLASECLLRVAADMPQSVKSMPMLWLLKMRLLGEAAALRDRPAASDGPVSAASDGPVSAASANLSGVTDVVTVHADHIDLCVAHGSQPPAAWEAVRERLMR